jgi:hypothetical protein
MEYFEYRREQIQRMQEKGVSFGDAVQHIQEEKNNRLEGLPRGESFDQGRCKIRNEYGRLLDIVQDVYFDDGRGTVISSTMPVPSGEELDRRALEAEAA